VRPPRHGAAMIVLGNMYTTARASEREAFWFMMITPHGNFFVSPLLCLLRTNLAPSLETARCRACQTSTGVGHLPQAGLGCASLARSAAREPLPLAMAMGEFGQAVAPFGSACRSNLTPSQSRIEKGSGQAAVDEKSLAIVPRHGSLDRVYQLKLGALVQRGLVIYYQGTWR